MLAQLEQKGRSQMLLCGFWEDLVVEPGQGLEFGGDFGPDLLSLPEAKLVLQRRVSVKSLRPRVKRGRTFTGLRTLLGRVHPYKQQEVLDHVVDAFDLQVFQFESSLLQDDLGSREVDQGKRKSTAHARNEDLSRHRLQNDRNILQKGESDHGLFKGVFGD